MSILVIAEHDNACLSEACLHAVSAARCLAGSVTLLVAGDGCRAVAEAAQKIEGVNGVLLVEAACYQYHLAENMAALIAELGGTYSHIVMTASSSGKNIAPRVAALLDVQAITEVIAIDAADTFRRPMYAGNIVATVQSHDPIKVLTVRATAFSAAEISAPGCPLECLNIVHDTGLSTVVDQQLAQLERPELGSAKVVVAGGRGLQSAENFQLLYTLADKLGAAVGASRAAVDAGFIGNDLQVGQTGKIVAPALYIAVGISGAVQHLAGMKDSKIIVAINSDESAPIFQVADYGLVADLFETLPALSELL